VTPAVAPYVSAISVMLAAYGFFYNASKSAIEAGQKVGSAAPNLTSWKAQTTKVERARGAALVLTIVPLVVWGIFAEPMGDKLLDALDFDYASYQALDVAFVALVNAWLVIAFLLGRQWAALRGERKDLERNKPDPAG
jgi:hypothetical protein